ncbi:MAG: CPBP family intramembrane glutamic endopeptidase [Patescibacteria group bacterium]
MSKKSVVKKTPPSTLDALYHLWGWIVIVWALYRYFFHLPEWADEFVFKPLVFALPVLWYVRVREKRSFESLGLTTKNIFTSIYIGLGFGLVFALEGIAANAIKYGKIQLLPNTPFEELGIGLMILLSLATAFSEELLSRGFVFTRIYEKTKNLPYAAFLSSIMFVFLHVPILVTGLKLHGVTLALFFVTDFVLAFANSLLLYNTRSLVAPILVHIFWNMTVALYL